MILHSLDSIADLSLYPKVIRKALEYLKNTDFSSLADGEYELDGRNVCAKVFTVESRKVEETHAEYHEEYIDIQYWISGGEKMGFLARKDQAYDIYSAESDLFLLSNPLEGERFIDCRAGDYMILFPSDIHRPAIEDGCNKKYRKVVIKVKVSALREEN